MIFELMRAACPRELYVLTDQLMFIAQSIGVPHLLPRSPCPLSSPLQIHNDMILDRGPQSCTRFQPRKGPDKYLSRPELIRRHLQPPVNSDRRSPMKITVFSLRPYNSARLHSSRFMPALFRSHYSVANYRGRTDPSNPFPA